MNKRLVTLLGALCVAVFSCGDDRSGPDAVVLIVIDTLRPDHLGSYGSQEASTPNLDALARKGTRFKHAVTPAPITLPAISSLLTGRLPFHHGVRDNEHYVLPQSEVTLAERFQDAGWKTGAVVASGIIAADRGLGQGFDSYDDRFTGEYPIYRPSLKVVADQIVNNRRRADEVTRRGLSLIDSFGNDPFFLFLHYFDVHSYYDPPPEFARLHPGRLYDGEISFVDSEIGKLMKRLEDRDGAVVMVVSDHGEGLGEHGEPEHGFLVYQSTISVPVIVAGPGIQAGAVRPDPISLIDLEPTLATWLGLPEVPDRDGRSLHWNRVASEGVTLYSETFRTLVSYHWSELRAIQRGPLKLISGPTSELYNLNNDPDETEPLDDGETVAAMRSALEFVTDGETREDVIEALGHDVDPNRKELLESLGYVGGADEPPKPDVDYPHPLQALPEWIARQEDKVLYRKGINLAVAGRYEESIAVFDTVLTRDPRADVYYNRGLARRRAGDDSGFLADLAKAMQADPDYIPAMAMMAQVHQEAERLDEAGELWKRVHTLDPDHAGALGGLANWHALREEWPEALPYLRSLVNAAPQDPTSRYNLGFAAYQAGRSDEARTHLDAFIRLAPDDPRVGSIRELLNQTGDASRN